jgi:hypothetical protein
MAKEFRVFRGVAQPDKNDGTPIYTFVTSYNQTQDLEYVLNQYVDEGWEIVSLTLPSSYSEVRGEHYGPATIIFSRKAGYR